MENEGEVFLNSVPLLASLSREDRVRLLQALEEKVYDRDAWVIRQVGGLSLTACLAHRLDLPCWCCPA